MTDVELEHAAMAPRRWIELCGAASKKQHSNDPGASRTTLRLRSTRFIKDAFVTANHPRLFIVPGGRYLVGYSLNGISIWDLGYTSSADCKLIASVGPEGEAEDGPDGSAYSCMVQATSDGMGLIIFSFPFEQCSIYEIYPQSETPQLTRIAHLHRHPVESPWIACLLPDKVLWYYFHGDSIVFKVWDYRMNHSIVFASDVGFNELICHFMVTATKTAIIVIYLKEILIWAIPSLPPQSPDFFDHYPTHIPPLSRIAFPDGIQIRHPEFVESQTMSRWYCGSFQPFYLNILCQHAKLHRFEIIVQPDLIDASLHMMNTGLVPDDFYNFDFKTSNICEDNLGACCERYESGQFGVYTWSRFTTATSRGGPAVKVLLPRTIGGNNCLLCPASGKYVHLDRDVGRIVVVDFF